MALVLPNGVLIAGVSAGLTKGYIVATAPAATYPFGGPYSATYTTPGRPQAGIWNAWRDMLWPLRLYPQTAGKWRTTPPLSTGLADRPFLCIEYDDLYSDLVDPLTFFSTYSIPVVIAVGPGLVGAAEGASLCAPVRSPPTPPPSPPAPDPLPAGPIDTLVYPGGEFREDFCVDFDVDFSTVAAEFFYQVADGAANPYYRLLFLANRMTMFPYIPDYEQAPRIRFDVLTDVFTSDYLIEQRTCALQAAVGGERSEARHVFDVVFKSYGKEESTTLWNTILRGRHRRFAVPWFAEYLRSSVNGFAATSLVVANLDLDEIVWNGYGPVGAEIVRLSEKLPGVFECRKITAWNTGANSFTVDHPWSLSVVPQNQVFCLLRYMVIESVSRKSVGDEQVVTVSFRSVD